MPRSTASAAPSSTVSEAGSAAKSRQICAALPVPFSCWDYMDAIEIMLDGTKRSTVMACAAVPYALFIPRPLGSQVSRFWRCALSGTVGAKPEMAHMLPARGGKAEEDVALLIQAGVIPAFAKHDSPANLVPLISGIHRALDAREINLLPDSGAVVEPRLFCEYKFYASRLLTALSPSPPGAAPPLSNFSNFLNLNLDFDHLDLSMLDLSRPPFETHYADLERTPTIVHLVPNYQFVAASLIRTEGTVIQRPTAYALPRTAAEVNEHELDGMDPYPPIELLCSANMLIFAAHDRALQPSPAPLPARKMGQVISNGVHLLRDYWLVPQTRTSILDLLKETEKHFLSLPDSPFYPYFADPHVPPTFLPPPPVRFPGTVSTRGTYALQTMVLSANVSMYGAWEEEGQDRDEEDGEVEDESDGSQDRSFEAKTPALTPVGVPPSSSSIKVLASREAVEDWRRRARGEA
ncbi:hypothetical protein JCM8547_008827 [Rhodosporidiobolus lusitaniae]